jgi:hypothetical protein
VDLDNILHSAISVLLAASAILVVAEALGFLPIRVSRWLNKNRLAQTIDILGKMGLDIDRLHAVGSSSMTAAPEEKKYLRLLVIFAGLDTMPRTLSLSSNLS